MSSRVHIDHTDHNDGQNGQQRWIEGRGSRERLQAVREAGWSRVSWVSVLAGVLAAVGAFALCIGAAAAVLQPLGIPTESLSDNDWNQLGLVAGLAAGAALLAAFAFGGYVAGRMARRAGLRHGVLVFLVGVVLLAAGAGIAQLEGALPAIRDRLEGLGAPTGGSAWTGVATISGVVALAGMLFGSLLGAVRGERWHERLVARALDPNVGPDAELRADVEAQRKAAERAMARARKAGVLSADDERSDDPAPEREHATAEAARADDGVKWRGAPEPTASGPVRRPSSPS
jgi:hypothetical protein